MRKQYREQDGMVSFVVTLIMILVITLIVVGFSQVVQRTQREALDRQLGSQAQYAAESGINKIISINNADKTNGWNSGSNKNSCSSDGDDHRYNSVDWKLNDATSTKVTCVLVNPRPEDLRVGANTTSSKILPVMIVDKDGTSHNASSLKLRWAVTEGQSADPAKCSAFISGFPKTIGTCGFGLLRVDLTRANATATATDLMNATATLYMKPVSSGTAYTLDDSSPKGNIIKASCSSASRTCTASVTLGGAWNTSNFYMRLSSIYRDISTVVIDATTSATDDAYFSGAQVMIDSTGKSQDVLKRIKVRYSLPSSSLGRGTHTDKATPPYVVRSSASDICKKFTYVDSSTDIINSCDP